MTVKVMGIDIAKNNFQLNGVDDSGKAILKKRLTRDKLAAFARDRAKTGAISLVACVGLLYTNA